MTGEIPTVVVVIALLLIAYPVAMRLLAHAVQPLRLRMADQGKALLVSPHLSERRKVLIDSMLDDAYDWTFAILACIAFPLVAVKRALGYRVPEADDPIRNSDARDGFNRFVLYYLVAIAAANPLFTVVFLAEAIIVRVVLWPFGTFKRTVDMLLAAFLCAEKLRNEHGFRHAR